MPQCFIRLMPQLVPAEKGIIVEIIRAKQSATSLFGAHAKAGICPKIKKSVKCDTSKVAFFHNTSILIGTYYWK